MVFAIQDYHDDYVPGLYKCYVIYFLSSAEERQGELWLGENGKGACEGGVRAGYDVFELDEQRYCSFVQE